LCDSCKAPVQEGSRQKVEEEVQLVILDTLVSHLEIVDFFEHFSQRKTSISGHKEIAIST
jgi:hypothetical protein